MLVYEPMPKENRPHARRALPRRRGARFFTDESTDKRVNRIRKAAVELVNKHGLQALSFTTLARDLKLTRTAPLHYFGSAIGLLAAIADKGFEELTVRLREE